jgi:S1-C subfamily serine protease
VPFDDDAADDVTGFRPPPHPDDRLWRHPSEVYAAEPAIPLRTHGRLWPWGIAAVGTAGVMLAGAGTLILGVRDQVTDGDQRVSASLSPLPSPLVDGRSLMPRSREGVTDLADVARLSDELAPSLVQIEGTGATGSGVVVGADGLTLTTATLVHGLDDVTVTLPDGRHVTGEVQGTDPLTDIAVVDLPGRPETATMADPADVGAGEGVLAMGAGVARGRPAATRGPLRPGHERLVRSGHEAVDGLLHLDVPAQITARGGPLVDQHGMVVGITIWTDDRATYALPIDVAAEVAEDIVTEGHADHAWLGIHGHDLGDTGDAGDSGEVDVLVATGGSTVLADERPATSQAGGSDEQVGVVVAAVDDAGPAGGVLEPGDVIVQVDDRPVAGMSDLAAAVGRLSPGDDVTLVVDRAGDDTRVHVTLDDRPAGV